MPRADPSRSSESATRHLFRHFFNEQELVSNPYVGAALAAGRLTMPELQARLAAAARSIEEADRISGNRSRGTRQAAALVECTLKRRAPAAVAAELGLSVRQLFRERQAAWTRALRYLIPAEPTGPSGALFADVQCNQAAKLFSSGNVEAGETLLRHMLAEATGIEKFMLAALAAELHQQVGSHATADALVEARLSYSEPDVRASKLCSVTMALLDELFAKQTDLLPKSQLDAGIADAVVMSPGIKWWMIRLSIRLLIAKYRRDVASYDRRSALRTAEAAINWGECVPALPEVELFNLRLLAARVDWMVRGSTPRAKAALVANYQTASANGWLSEVANTGSLLASMMIVAGESGGEDYARTALALAGTLPENKTANFAYLNLVVAKLDAGRPNEAARLLSEVAPLTKTAAHNPNAHELRDAYQLLARELQAIGVAGGASLPLEHRDGVGLLATRDPLQAAYYSRVASLESERLAARREAVRLISEAWEIATRYGDWMAHRTIGRTYRQLTRRPPP